MSLTCPKCQSKMRSYERSGVTVDQCKQCRGIFLNAGELEHLQAAEVRYLGLEPAGVAAPPPIKDYDAPRRPTDDDTRKRAERLYADDRKARKVKKRKKTVLESFFD